MEGDDTSEIAQVEATGKDVEEAIENGLYDLDLERREVDVEVLTKGRAGLFGIGGEQAKVRVTAIAVDAQEDDVVYEAPEGDVVEFAHETLKELLVLMDLDAEATVRPPETAGDGVGLVQAVFDVTGEDMGVLIGRRGSTMASLQYLVNLMVSRKYRGEAPFSVDVEGYRRRREESLEDLAHRSAESVRNSGRPVTLEAMPAYERRIVHLTLSKDPTVGTASVGEGEHRKVRISVRQ